MPKRTNRDNYDEFELNFPRNQDPNLIEWRRQLARLPLSDFSIREATTAAWDARKVSDLQAACEPISVRSVRDNASMIGKQTVLLAEIDDAHIGFCVSALGRNEPDPLFIQAIGVASEAQQRGVALALLAASAERAPQRDVAFATQDKNQAARKLTQRFANEIGATIRRVRLGTYPDSDFGIRRGTGYRPWIIQRRSVDETR